MQYSNTRHIGHTCRCTWPVTARAGLSSCQKLAHICRRCTCTVHGNEQLSVQRSWIPGFHAHNACCRHTLAPALHAHATQTMQTHKVHQMNDTRDIYLLSSLATGTEPQIPGLSGENGMVGLSGKELHFLTYYVHLICFYVKKS